MKWWAYTSEEKRRQKRGKREDRNVWNIACVVGLTSRHCLVVILYFQPLYIARPCIIKRKLNATEHLYAFSALTIPVSPLIISVGLLNCRSSVRFRATTWNFYGVPSHCYKAVRRHIVWEGKKHVASNWIGQLCSRFVYDQLLSRIHGGRVGCQVVRQPAVHIRCVGCLSRRYVTGNHAFRRMCGHLCFVLGRVLLLHLFFEQKSVVDNTAKRLCWLISVRHVFT